MVVKKNSKLPFLKIKNVICVKTIVPFWLSKIHPPTVGSSRENSFSNIVNALINEKKDNDDLVEEWFIDETQFPAELLLNRHVLIGSKLKVSDELNSKFIDRFNEIYCEMGQVDLSKIDVIANIGEIKTYFFSYGIGFVKISIDVKFNTNKLKQENFLNACETTSDTIQTLIDSHSLPPFTKFKKFEKLLVDNFSTFTGNIPYTNWLMLPLERDNITLEQNISSTLRNNTFIEMFVSGKDSQKGKYLLKELDMNSKLEEDQMEWLDDDLMDNNINDHEKELLDDLTEEYTEKYEKLFNHYLNEGFSEEEALEKADKEFSEEFEKDNIESEDDADLNSLDDEKLLRLIKNNLREFTFKSNIKTTTFNNETNFLKFLPKMNEKTSLSIINNWQASNLLMISEIGNQWKTGDYLISLRFLDNNSSYEEDENFSPYFNFKTIIYECLYHANLGLYSHLFRITKAASLKPKEFLKEFNGFSRARNLLDILRFESSYDIIKTDTYKIFHDCSEFNIERELSKNEKVFDLIEKRLTTEKTKQEKNVSDVVSLGLAVISILTIGLAAADVTNFLGFKDLFNNNIKILIISLPVIIFLIYLRVSLIRVKKLEDK